jgi:hypothetical protein
MALEDDYSRATRALIKSLRERADELERTLLRKRHDVPAGVLTSEGKLLRPSTTTAKAADAIERILERGAKAMKREELIRILVDQKLVGKEGITDRRRLQYADLAIDAGIEAEKPYIKEDRDGTIHWIPGQRKSRVSKRR